MNPHEFVKELHGMERAAKEALGAEGLSKTAYYRKWLGELIQGTLPAFRYPKVRKRLIKFNNQ